MNTTKLPDSFEIKVKEIMSHLNDGSCICWFKYHERGWTSFSDGYWSIECKRCGHFLTYFSPRARLVGVEVNNGFTGK